MGPTASGKTGLAMELAARGPYELVSVDSAMIYRGMDIGTAKPSREERARIAHRLIDIRDPAEPYSAGDFREDAIAAGDEILSRGSVPLYVGGTMLYFRVLRDGIAELPASNVALRGGLAREAEELGWGALHARLASLDPAAAKRIHPNDPQRLQRALEVVLATGKPLSAWWREQAVQGIASVLDCALVQLAIVPQDRTLLHERIERRFLEMLEEGFLEEVRKLRERGNLDPALPAMKAVGYRQLWRHLDGEIDFDTMCHQALAATRQLAKRQLTWLRGWTGVHSLDGEDPGLVEAALKILGAVAIVPKQPPTEL
ncbi:MAG: tRNA (adenosine(37)-N6)-dimethylallyltransferase MiaA [Pseudomonadales bacterium]